ncbi:MAG: hypothetical protein MJD61_16370, partial [Proteobacteria bacterium]|nr:hypothetical protein [Pseudomonadota bacterium]
GINHTSNWTLDYAWPGDSLVFGAPLELPVHVALSVGNWSPPRPPISFLAVEVAQPDPTDPTHQPTDVLPRSARQLWSDFQDSGFRIAIVGASDNRCFQRQIGQLRTGVLIDGAVTYERYLEGLRLGRTQAVKGQGTVADLTAWSSSTPGDVKIIGDTLAVSSGSQVNFRVQATLKVAGMIELLGNGQPQPWCQMMGQVGTNDFTCGPIAMLSSAWMSVRAPLVQTSPIYVELDGVPYRPYNAALCRNISHIQRLIDTYAGPGGPLFSRLGEYLNAQAEYQARLDPACRAQLQ